MEFIKEEQEAQDWKNLPSLDAPLDCNIDTESIHGEVPGTVALVFSFPFLYIMFLVSIVGFSFFSARSRQLREPLGAV